MTRLFSVTVSYTTWVQQAIHNAAYILDTFPIVLNHDVDSFGSYRTQEMVLAYYNALAAGDTPPPTSPS